jgi:hypothetical protein
MEPQVPSDKTEEQKREDATEAKSNNFQAQFDWLLFGLLALGFVITFSYGASAGTCPPDPQHLPPAAAPAQPDGGPTAPPPGASQTRTGGGTSTAAADNSANANGAADNALVGNETANAPAGRGGEERPATIVRRPACNEAASDGLIGALLAMAIALAALAVGTFVGFLFGLPRSLTSSEFRAARRQQAAATQPSAGGPTQPPAAGTTPSDAAGGGAGGSGSDVNTNLEKISDWLTTIIVGVGLTKLQEIPAAIESFGDRVALYFSYGGKVFGIAGGLFFLIAGFFLAYVGTRVKLSLVFVWSQRTNQGAATVRALVEQGPLGAVAGPSSDRREADRELLNRSLGELRTPEELAAYGGAAAREGKRELAANVLADAVKEKPTDPRILGDYAGVLALTGDDAGADGILQTIRTIAPAALPEAQDKVDIGRLRAGLYDGGYERSIAIGEALLNRPIAASEPWIHIWLACAYGQKHAALKRQQPPAQTTEIDAVRQKAVQEVDRALTLDPGLKPTVRGLLDPAAADNDLASLADDPTLVGMVVETPVEQPPATDPAAQPEAAAEGEGPAAEPAPEADGEPPADEPAPER